MKSLKPILLTAALAFAFSSVTFAQISSQTQGKPARQKTDQQSPEKFNKDFDGRMAKLQDAYNKLKEKEASVKNPEMKADLDKMLDQMKTVTTQYNAYKGNTKMSPDEQKQAREKLMTDMQNLRQTRDALKSKYGGKRAQKKDKAQRSHSGEAAPAQQ